jgi:hypothetical protein
MFRIDASTADTMLKEIEVIFIIKQNQDIKLCLALSEANEESNKENAQIIGTLKFNTRANMSDFDAYEQETLQHAKKILSETDYFYLQGERLRLTALGQEHVPDGRAMLF